MRHLYARRLVRWTLCFVAAASGLSCSGSDEHSPPIGAPTAPVVVEGGGNGPIGGGTGGTGEGVGGAMTNGGGSFNSGGRGGSDAFGNGNAGAGPFGAGGNGNTGGDVFGAGGGFPSNSGGSF